MTSMLLINSEELRQELRAIIADTMAEALEKFNATNKPTPKPTKDTLTLREAVDYLNELGQPITIGTFRHKLKENAIPYVKCGKHIVLSRNDLKAWAESRRKPSAHQRAIEAMAKSVLNHHN